MKFVMSYSCGKDSTLSLQQLIDEGHEPVALLTMIKEDLNRAWFHGADLALLHKLSQSLQIPLILCPSLGPDYHIAFEKGLMQAKELGAELVGFGDIDIEENRAWDEERCKNTGLPGAFHLWQRKRTDIVEEIVQNGYTCLIKTVNNKLLPKSLLGEKLSPDTLNIMKVSGIDVCGENGEYHTIVVDGPIFKTPVSYTLGKVLDFGDWSAIEVE